MIQMIKVLKFGYNDWNGLINDTKKKVKQTWNSKLKWVNVDRRKETRARIDATNERGISFDIKNESEGSFYESYNA